MLDINFSEIKESAKKASEAGGFKAPGKYAPALGKESKPSEGGYEAIFVKPKNVVREDRSKRPQARPGGPKFMADHSSSTFKVTPLKFQGGVTQNEVATETYPGPQTSPSGFKYVAPVKKIIWSLFAETKTISLLKGAVPKGALQLCLQNAAAGIEKPAAAPVMQPLHAAAPAPSPVASTLETAPVVVLAPEAIDAVFIEKLKALLASKERSSALELENKILREQIVAMGGEIALLKAEVSIKKG